MRYAIDTAPKDGKVVILEDDASGTYDVAHWSVEAGNWIGEDSEPSKITPTHWYAMPGDKYALPEDNRSGGSSQVAPSASRARNHNFFRRFSFFRFSSKRSAPQRPAAASDVIARRPVVNATPMNAAIGAQAAPVKAKRAPHARWRFSAFSITAGIIGAVLIGMYLFRAEIATRYSGYLDVAMSAATDGKAVDQENQRPQDSQKTDSVTQDIAALRQQAEADRAGTQAATQETAEVKQVAEASVLEAQSLEQERRRAETLANELAETRRSVDARNLQLRELANELSAARREIDTHVAMSNKAADEAAQLKQAAESATVEMRQSLQRERDRAEALERDLARRTADPPIALQTAASSPVAQMAAASPHIAAEAQNSPEAARLIARASALLRQGDIGAARIVLERAAETGSAQASFTLAETYDPVILSTWGTYGTRGDTTKARELYANAYAGGIQEAKDRFNALRQ